MNKNRYLSLLLRHKPETENLKLDEHGWCDVKDLLTKLGLSIGELDIIVFENNKQRFRYNDDKSMIKANQGHSIKIKDDFKRRTPPHILYHGTTIDNMSKIKSGGLKKMRRNHVHLSDDLEVAKSVGMRYAKYHNKLWVIYVHAGLMNKKGYEFYLSENNVWLTDHVPATFIN